MYQSNCTGVYLPDTVDGPEFYRKESSLAVSHMTNMASDIVVQGSDVHITNDRASVSFR